MVRSSLTTRWNLTTRARISVVHVVLMFPIRILLAAGQAHRFTGARVLFRHPSKNGVFAASIHADVFSQIRKSACSIRPERR